ncbi:reverse transcriptase [Gossypium australe]|uniref:Reverse transcriptase n=1 Tax=Gossypium australe TaxID=47621 RepID=A0A5B6VAI3_9ROSI|nr:reverse transcriptase [Gossypium australe]
MLKVYNPQVVFFVETKLSKDQMERVKRRCGFLNGTDVVADGSKGGLNHVDAEVTDNEMGKQWRLTSFYRNPYTRNRDASWNELRGLRRQQDLPWLVCGDFNEILYVCGKVGGVPRDKGRMEAFRGVLEECHLMDMGYSREMANLPETDIRKCLGRGVANAKWMDMFPVALI